MEWLGYIGCGAGVIGAVLIALHDLFTDFDQHFDDDYL